jgi:dTDP-4-dehydrorhamnose reductase
VKFVAFFYPVVENQLMKVLIAGCLGMLGTDLMAAFSPVHDVIGLDLPEMDIAVLEQCDARMQELRPDVVINAAAFTRVDDCETQEKKAFLVNGHGAGNLSKAAASTGSLFVHYSTDYIFDGLKSEAYLEEDAPNPKSIYGKSKLLGEDLIRRNCPNHLIIRTSWLFGRNGPNFIRTIVDLARKGAPLRVVDDQRGSPTYSRDLAAYTLKMIAAGCRSTYHVTNSGSCTWFELASRAVQWAGIEGVSIAPVPTSEFPRPAPRPANSILANARLKQDGLALMRPWQTAAREYIEHHLKQ